MSQQCIFTAVNLVPRVMAIPATVVYFTCYEQLRCYLCYRPNVASDQWKPLVSGALARSGW